MNVAEIELTARRFIATYGWQSVDLARLVARVGDWLGSSAPADESYGLERLCERAAAEQIYEHCERGALRWATPDEKRRQELAYGDLGRYLLVNGPRLLAGANPGVHWQSAVEDALGEVHTALARCKDTAAFLGYALTILHHQLAGERRAQRRQHERQQPLDAAIPLKRDQYESVDPAGDKQLLLIVGNCLRNTEQRIIALSLVLGLKRREILLVFAEMGAQYDNSRRAIARRLGECSRMRLLTSPDAAWAPCLVRGCADPGGTQF